MKKETLNEIIKTMAIKASLCNYEREAGAFKDNFRTCPVYSELKGMELTLKLMGIDFDYEFSDDCSKITAIKAKGIRYDV